MAINAQQPYMTLDELLARGEDASFEIINGKVVDMPPAGGLHQIIAGNIVRILSTYAYKAGNGMILPDQMTYLMHSDSAGLKDSFVPDISFLSRYNIPSDWNIEKPHPGVPDLAIEIISPGDDAQLVSRKTRTYLEKGSKQVWLVYPRLKEVHQYRASQPDTVRIYRSGVIDTDDLFPDLKLPVNEIFEIPDYMPSPQSSQPDDNNDKDND
jgi:Uma2 family endonuclease